ncbi:MAG: DUF4339 domain-containing protein [Planctomycetaceae bacterium]|nr:DUF4339 domain-containing protein [Planctomycetaceae bacterium]
MPTYWKYTSTDQEEVGPVGFFELVKQVQAGVVDRDSKVYSFGQKKWIYASDVLGLFYMAKRGELRGMFDDLKEDAVAIGFTEGELGDLLEQAEVAGEELDEPSWQKRLREVARERGFIAAEKRQQEREERYARKLEKGISQAAEDAILREDHKEQLREHRQRWRQRIGQLLSDETVGTAFAWFAAFAAANLVAFGILNWTATELQRFPDRRGVAASLQVFPIWGECSQPEYYLLLIPTMIVSAIIAFNMARLAASLTD